ncbi:hypothetical protein, variant [Saprolegnia diclina VS20]|nr:hypothetical protein, variant [Saprolegnia diclina VS20]EQC41057.1 hypothetical protein, variant [Saprolegnia diclina VS20]|eukprot:XP_008605901.1 hypothetical protein, variant [Saprolegnia diclina VS20]
MLGVWSTTANDARGAFSMAELTEATSNHVATKSFRKDYLAYCKLMALVPHPKLLPNFDEEDKDCLHQNYDESDVATITVRNWMLDMPSLLLMDLALQRATSVHTLILFNVSLTVPQLQFVCTQLPSTSLKTLHLEWNDVPPLNLDAPDTIIEDHTVCFARLLAAPTQLTQLSLRANGISSEGAIALAGALRQNATLTQLNLFRNGIGDVGVEALAQALSENKTLQHLSVANNGVSGAGALALVRAITHYVLSEAQLKQLADMEVLVQTTLEAAKKQKKKLDRADVVKELNMVETETVDGVVYGLGNSTLQSISLSGNELSDVERDLLPLQQLLEEFDEKLQMHFAGLKVQRMFTPGQLTGVGKPLSTFLVL